MYVKVLCRLQVPTPHYLKAERSHDTFRKPICHKAKKQLLPLIYMEKILSIARHKKEPTKSYQIHLIMSSFLHEA